MSPDQVPHEHTPHVADDNRKVFRNFFRKYPDCQVIGTGGRILFVSMETGMICSADDVTAGLVDLDPFVETAFREDAVL